MMRLYSPLDEHSLEISLVQESESEYDLGDALLSVSVRSHGFGGHTSAWVLQEEILRFARSLVDLNRNLRGSATLRSMSPGELEIELLAVSGRGHLAVRGSLGWHVTESERTYWHAAHFGFEFEPGQLEAATAEAWVIKHTR